MLKNSIQISETCNLTPLEIYTEVKLLLKSLERNKWIERRVILNILTQDMSYLTFWLEAHYQLKELLMNIN